MRTPPRRASVGGAPVHQLRYGPCVSEGETVVLIGNLLVGAICWALWYQRNLKVHALLARGGLRGLVLLTPVLCAVLLWWVLATQAASDVRDSTKYMFFYMVFGAAWLAVAVRGLSLLGLSVRDDVVERGNRAAAWAIAGAMVALMLCFAGGNIGEGPGWWVVWFAAALATSALGLLWLLLVRLWPVADRITIDRDVATGRRTGLLFVSLGLVLGRAVAGDWHSAGQTVVDFGVVAWPALVLVVVAGLAERRLPRAGALAWLLPGVMYLAGATTTVVLNGRP